MPATRRGRPLRGGGAGRIRAAGAAGSGCPYRAGSWYSRIRTTTMPEAFICDGVRTPIGRYGGGLAKVRAHDLAAIPIKALMARHPKFDWSKLDDVFLGCANQAGEDNRNVARMALLLAGLPVDVPGATLHRLCGSGMDAIGMAARAIKAGESDVIIAGGVESMSRAPF